MRKEFMMMAAVAAVALAGYLSWQNAKEGPVVQTSAPAAVAPQAAAPQNAPVSSGPAAPAQTGQPAQQ